MINFQRLASLAAACGAVLLFSSCGGFPARADVVLVDAATPPAVIITVREGDTLEERAALWLSHYLQKISGKPFSLRPPVDALPERAIIIGKRAVEAAGVTVPADLGADGFIIKTQGQRLYISGGGEMGTAFGVFAFLQDQLNCKWWSWTEEEVPQQAALKIGVLNIRQQPAFKMHDIMSMEAQTRQNHFAYKSRALSTLQFTGNHTMYPLLTAAAQKNPEFWPLNDKGERKSNKLHFNYLAPGIAEALAAELAKEVEKRKGNLENFIYFAGQGDWYGGLDQAEASKKAYAEDGNSGPLVQMINRTGAILQKKYPGIKIGTFAYMSTDSPPKQTVPAENVHIWLPRLRYGITLSIEEAASEKNLDEKSRARSQNIKNSLEKWAKIAPERLFVWEYGVNYNHFMRPQPVLRAMAENIKFYDRIGVRGIMIQGNYVSPGGDLAVMKNWIWSRLLWNPKLELNALLKEFCAGYYGPAAAEMLEYVNVLEDSVRKPVFEQMDEFDKSTNYLTPEVKTQMRAALKRAEAKTQGEANAAYLRRVREAGVSLEAVELWSEGPLVEKDGKLLRADINKEAGGEYTFQRAKDMVQYSRGSSKTEWGNGISQQRGIIAANGGPLFSISRGPLTAKVAPYQGNRRLWTLSFDGRTVIRGSQVSPGSAYFEPAGEQTADKIEIEGEVGFSNWNPTPNRIQRDTFSFNEDGAVVWSGVLRQTLKGKPLAATPLVETLYPVGSIGNGRKTLVEVRTANGWKEIPLEIYRGTGRPDKLLDVDAGLTDFQTRVTTSDKKIVIIDTYPGTSAKKWAVTYSPRDNAFKTFVELERVTTEFEKESPAFRRVIKVQAAQ